MIEGIFVEGLLYGIMVLGVFITFRIMDFPDLTVDGSFPLGAAIMAACLTAGLDPWTSLMLAFMGGILAGCITAAIHNYLKVPGLLAGIITMIMLKSINIRVMGGAANMPVMDDLPTIIAWFTTLVGPLLGDELAHLLLFFLIAMVVKTAIDIFFRTDLGITIGAMGNNPQMVTSSGVDVRSLKFIGLGLSNGLVALSGAFAAQYLGSADIGLGSGIIIAGLASVMVGEFIFKSNRIWVLTIQVLLGSIIYRGIMFAGRYYGYYIGLTPSDLNLITGVLIVIMIAITMFKKQAKAKVPQTAKEAPRA